MKDIIYNLTKKQKIILSIISISILIIIFIYIYKNLYIYESSNEILINNDINEVNYEEESNNINISNTKEKVIVHVIGEVNNPGVVTLNEGARIIDAINSAGGKTEEADLSKINLAYIIEDGMQIYIPRINENLNQVQIISEDATKSISDNSYIKTDDNNDKNNSKVNINTASKEKLETLPGIGDTTAQKIIEYREQNGKFKKIEDIQNVSGIGEAKYNSLKDKITV